MLVYHFHPETKEFLGSTEAERDPEEQEETYLIPANSTTKAPKEVAGPGEVLVLQGNNWKVVEDNRGKKYWTPQGEERVMKDLGPLPSYALPGKPNISTTPPSKKDVQDEARRRILSVAPEHVQRNLIAKAVLLLAKGKENWSEQEKAEWAAGEKVWNHIQAVREQSNHIEKALKIPPNYKDNGYWPEWK